MTEAASHTGRVRVHYGMAGSVPLQLFEFVFEPTGCYVLDCGAFTPLFDLSRGKHTRRAAALDDVYDEHGLDGLLAVADTTTWLPWETVDCVTLNDGSRFTRPKLSVQTRGDAPVWSVRLHGVDTTALADGIAGVVDGATRFEHVERTRLF
jgi:hypothetical protein